MKKISCLFSLLLLIYACGDKNASNETNKFDSPKSLFVDYISEYSSGLISSSAPIVIKLSKSVEGIKPGDTASDLIKFDPNIKGEAKWEDDRTVVFQPEGKLPQSQSYQAVFKIGEILETPSDRKEFKFSFKTLLQNFDVEFKGLSPYDITDLTRVKLEGSIQTADVADAQSIEKILSAQQNGKALDISWTHQLEKKVSNFSIEQISRGKKESEVQISWKGEAIGVDEEDDEDYVIPALDDFKITNVKVNRGTDKYISVIFSDPLLAKQNLSGFVTLNRSEPRYVIDKNELKLYPTSNLQGQVNLKVFSKIKNVAGFTLKADYEASFRLSQSKPDVRIVANDGVIIPNSEGLILPFEAVGLKAVDVMVVQVFSENVFQHLQVNNLQGHSELSRVGRPVIKKVVDLRGQGVTDLNVWNRYTLDLASIIEVDPGAMYEVQMSFRPQHSIYFCSNGDEEIEELSLNENWEEEEEESNWDSYQYYYNSDYDWRERENPCHISYYMYRDKAKKMVFASDIGLIAKRADKGDLHVFASNLVDAKAMADVNFAVYDYQHQVVGSGIANSKGEAKIQIKGNPFLLMAKKGEQYAYLKLSDGESLSLSNFNTTGQEIKEGIKGYIYGERGVWRPGDDIYLSFMLDDPQHRLPENYPVVLELNNPMGQRVKKVVKSESVEGLYHFALNTSPDAPTGNWQAVVKAGGASFTKKLKIETVKPNRLKIELDFKQDRITAAQGSVSGSLDVKWLHGAVANGLKAEYDMTLYPVKTTFEDYPNYTFDDNSKDFYSSTEQIFSGRLDQNGHASVNVPIETQENAPGALRAVFDGKVYEEGGNFSIDKTSIPFYPYASFVGIQAPEGDKRGMLLTDEDHTIQIATVSADGKALSRSDLEVELYKLEWRWWWDQSANQAGYVSRSYSSPIQTDRVDSNGGKATWKLRVNHPSWGRYFLRVTDPVSGHSVGKVIYMDWPGWAGKGKRGDMGGVNMLSFELEKEEYQVGDEIKINIPSSKGSRILTSLETGDKIIQSFWVESEEESTTISFEATSDMAPNVYANIMMIQPHAQTANDLPIRLYGIQSIQVTDPTTVLHPEIKMPKELSPEQEFTVEVSEQEGRKMAYTLAMVEEGLLDLTRFQTPNPWGSFYARESLGVKTWDVYDDVVGAYGGKIERLLAIGGGGEMDEEAKKKLKANRFKPVVKYLGPFFLESGKTAKHKIKMPQYVGSVRTMVVAGYEGAFGSAEETTAVKQPVMVLATLPRVVGPDEEISIPVTIFVNDPNVKTVNLSVSSDAGLSILGSATQNISMNGNSEMVHYFKAKAGRNIGIAKVEVKAKAGNHEAKYDVEMNLRPANPMMVDVQDKFLSANESIQLTYDPLGMIGTNEAKLEISSLPPINLEQRLKYLIRYPHGCIEQTTSSVFAQLYLGEITSLSENTKSEIERNIKAAIDRLRTFQTINGGFSYWPGQAMESDWGSNYAGHFLVEAKKAGYAVPENMLSSWIKYQKNQARQWSRGGRTRSDLVQAYRLYGLALAGEKAMGAMNRLKETTPLSNSAKWRLALTYAVAGYDDVANELVADLSTTVEDYRELSYTYGSGTRDEAMILETLAYLDQKEKAFPVLQRLAEKMGQKNQWMSTQTTAFCLIGIQAYTKGVDTKNVSFQVKEGGANADYQTGNYITTVVLKDVDKKVPLSVSNSGNAPIYVRLIRGGIPIEGNEEARARNLSFKVKYVARDGSTLDPADIAQSTDFSVLMTVHNTGLKGDYEELALTHIFPSGWEILNDRIGGESQSTSYDVPEYSDIRDDRVMIYFDLKANEKKTFEVKLNAAYKGKYYMPAAVVEAMYDNDIYANTAGKWVTLE
ncbi:alpha-2-macroglobulin family protein [Reichenbachiella ulvae]|uniref:MG2 domain-containing protein n=1 Tax=Reichenbachiella ulvae TaxID=2980104 RepID=A0ABT3CXM1_9BACT|nr:MG2 domain-containing protein [Reichenbachiella ulvae]MCV9388437.1 MG2 domain-containing protein [Reichenbachiella ulvae]